MTNLIEVENAKSVCKDRSKWKDLCLPQWEMGVMLCLYVLIQGKLPQMIDSSVGQVRVCDVRNLLEFKNRRGGFMKKKLFRSLPAWGATKVHMQNTH
jgi:hypothetical protein